VLLYHNTKLEKTSLDRSSQNTYLTLVSSVIRVRITATLMHYPQSGGTVSQRECADDTWVKQELLFFEGQDLQHDQTKRVVYAASTQFLYM